MRTKTLLLAAALSAAGIASSLAQSNVYSVNVVGYVNRTCSNTNTAIAGAAGGFTLLANPLDSHTNTLNGVLASFLPANARVQKWNGTTFDNYQKTATGWLPPTAGTVSLNLGEGFFVFIPNNAAPTTVTFVGDVFQGCFTNNYTLVNTLSGNWFPDTGTVTALGMVVPTNDKILTWGGSTYNTYTKTATGWLPPGSGPTINVADGFFVNVPATGASFSWTRCVTVQ